VDDIKMDEIVKLSKKEVKLYNDDDKKNKVGFGIKSREKVNLESVWKMDKNNKNKIKDEERMKKMEYEGKLSRVCEKMNKSLLEYRKMNG
jgi:hypothetical protein